MADRRANAVVLEITAVALPIAANTRGRMIRVQEGTITTLHLERN